MKQLLEDLGIPQGAVSLLEDNEACIALAKQPSQDHRRTKHIDVRYYWIRDLVNTRKINIIHCPTKDQYADCLTKVLSGCELRNKVQPLGLSKFKPYESRRELD